jgi:uncharacterized membrane protein HdeD (DUF308 family)
MKRDIWFFLFCIGLVFFCGPFLSIFHSSLTYYLFIMWIIFIGLIFLASTFSDRDEGGN